MPAFATRNTSGLSIAEMAGGLCTAAICRVRLTSSPNGTYVK